MGNLVIVDVEDTILNLPGPLEKAERTSLFGLPLAYLTSTFPPQNKRSRIGSWYQTNGVWKFNIGDSLKLKVAPEYKKKIAAKVLDLGIVDFAGKTGAYELEINGANQIFTRRYSKSFVESRFEI